ncbi:MAG: hypothetical protein ACYCUF_00795 [Acidimicrobiales bacterium]
MLGLLLSPAHRWRFLGSIALVLFGLALAVGVLDYLVHHVSNHSPSSGPSALSWVALGLAGAAIVGSRLVSRPLPSRRRGMPPTTALGLRPSMMPIVLAMLVGAGTGLGVDFGFGLGSTGQSAASTAGAPSISIPPVFTIPPSGASTASPTAPAPVTPGMIRVTASLALSEAPVGLFAAGSGGWFWAFEAPLGGMPPDQLQPVDPVQRSMLTPVLFSGTVTAFGATAGGRAIVATSGSGAAPAPALALYALAGQTVSRASLALPPRVSSVLAVSGDPKGGIWVVARESDGSTVAFLLAQGGSSSRSWSLPVGSGSVRDVAVAPGGTLAVAFGGGVASSVSRAPDVATVTSSGQVSTFSVPGAAGAVGFGGGGALWAATQLGPYSVALARFGQGSTTPRMFHLPRPAAGGGPLLTRAGGGVDFGFSQVGGGHGLPGLGTAQPDGTVHLYDVPSGVAPEGGVVASLQPLGKSELFFTVVYSRVLVSGRL